MAKITLLFIECNDLYYWYDETVALYTIRGQGSA